MAAPAHPFTGWARPQQSASVQERAGGPRAGKGAAVTAAMRAASTGCSACASGCAGRMWGSANAGGGAPTGEHKGQSMPIVPISTGPSSVCTSSLMVPTPEQMTSMDCGCTRGEAMAKPTDAMNHASTQRRSAEKVRRAIMGGDDTGEAGARRAIACKWALGIYREWVVVAIFVIADGALSISARGTFHSINRKTHQWQAPCIGVVDGRRVGVRAGVCRCAAVVRAGNPSDTRAAISAALSGLIPQARLVKPGYRLSSPWCRTPPHSALVRAIHSWSFCARRTARGSPPLRWADSPSPCQPGRGA